MGGCVGTKDPNKNINNQIQNHMKHDEFIDSTTRKLLLLGAGSSGKSTILKQMKYLWVYDNGFPQNQRSAYRGFIYSNLVELFQTLCDQLEEQNISVDDGNSKYKETINEVETMDEKLWQEKKIMDNQIKTALIALSKDSGIKKVYNVRNQFVIMDNSQYFLDCMTRMLEDNYIPTFTDITYSRRRTTGIVYEDFLFSAGKKGKSRYQIVDVGGQRTERRKWIKCFADVVAVLYCIALSGYNQMLWEDNTVNRMKESITLFEETISSKHLKDTNIIVFLNKRDLFEKKIGVVPFTVCYDKAGGFNGDAYDYESVIEFIKSKLAKLYKVENTKPLYFHVTCAADTNDIDRVFSFVHDIIIKNALIRSGMA